MTSNHLKRLWSKAMVVSVKEKAHLRRRQVRVTEMNESEPSMKYRERIKDVKTKGSSSPWDKLRGYLATDLSGIRYRGGMNVTQAFVRNLGTCVPDVKGETQVEETIRVRVPMRGPGADQLVVAVKSGKPDGAKGLTHFVSCLVVNQHFDGRN